MIVKIDGRDGNTYEVESVNGSVKIPQACIETAYYSDRDRLINKRYDVERIDDESWEEENEIFNLEKLGYRPFYYNQGYFDVSNVKYLVYGCGSKGDVVEALTKSTYNNALLDAALKYYDAIQVYRHAYE
jgi:hypothetical protein